MICDKCEFIFKNFCGHSIRCEKGIVPLRKDDCEEFGLKECYESLGCEV